MHERQATKKRRHSTRSEEMERLYRPVLNMKVFDEHDHKVAEDDEGTVMLEVGGEPASLAHSWSQHLFA